MIKKKYIFLDIDGVLNAPGDKIIHEMFEENKLKLLIDFIVLNDCKIVLTSSRRTIESDVKIIKKVFESYTELMLVSDRKMFKYRGQEIEYFIKQNSINNYVIFDDNDNGISDIFELKSHFVLVNYLTGLTEKDIEKAQEILI